ncbi:macro domain-containing protein [Fibrobacter sp. UWB13]|uniref:macro domain-containing protein n=1 Tax=Fibrobacter sp. UWB13 TaxID=1896204 RepID=UPI000A0D925C|nr:macro domain-containing protein [Fibrobacter sp. UWB13]SMG16666.1 hypothetical protein SAMN05720489_0863 [Fibrobacter sp. UWB13]
MKYLTKLFFVRYIETIGVFLLINELLCTLLGPDKLDFIPKPIIFGVLPVIVCIIELLRKLFFTDYSINQTDSKISLSFGNILRKKGIIIIPVNQEFDTYVGDGIVSPRSLHGEFINRFYKNDLTTLNTLIDAELQKQKTSYIARPNKTKGKQKSYPLGTCVRVEKNGIIFILAALTTFDDKCHAKSIDRFQRNEFLSKIWEWVRLNEEPSNIHFPLIGAGNSRMKGTSQEKYRAIVDSGIAEISQAKSFQTFDITLPFCNFSKYEEFDEYIRFKALYKDVSNSDQTNLGTETN